MIVALCGFMGCGKSTVGKILAKKLAVNFFDTDDCIEKKENRTIDFIFKEYGESHFRALEKSCIGQLLEQDDRVLSLGGGAVKDPETVNLLHQYATVVFINTSFDRIKKHIAMDKNVRPLAANSTDEAFFALYQSRFEIYQNASDFEVDGDGIAADVAEKILKLLKKL